MLREALAKEREKQQADDAAAAERDRLAKAAAAAQLQAQADRAQALKAEVAQLEQAAAQAKADAETEQRKAAEARKAVTSAEKTAALTPATAPAPAPVNGALDAGQIALVRPIQGELQRLGCYAGNDGDWTSAATRRGVARFVQYAKLASAPDAPNGPLLDDLKARHDRLCPSECAFGEVEAGGRCVAKTCGRGEVLSRTGVCVARPAARRETAVNAAPKAAAKSGHCFSFNGNQYCE